MDSIQIQESARPKISLPFDFYKKDSWPFLTRLFVLSALIVTGIGLALSHSFGVVALGIFVLGAMFTHAVELQHQCIHRTAFRTKRLNDFVGTLLGFPMLVSHFHYRASHLHHHRTLGTPMNHEFFKYDYSNSDRGIRILLGAFSFSRYGVLLKNFVKAISGQPFENIPSGADQKEIRKQYFIMAGLLLLVLSVSVFERSPLLLKLWLLPLVLVAEPLHFLIELPEHFRCEMNCKNPLKNTRTIKSGTFLTWFTNGNNYHVEHHLFPQVSNEKLSEVHAIIQPKIEYFNSSYTAFFKTCLMENRAQKVGVTA